MIISGQFNDSLTPIIDGVAITAQNYAYWLSKHHAPSFAVGPNVPKYRDTDNYILRFRSLPLQNAGPYRIGVPRVDRSFNKKIEQIPFDLVHAHCPFVSGNYALWLKKRRKIPMVATFHSKYRDDFAKWLKTDFSLTQVVNMIVKFYNQADSVWVPNEAIIDTLREYGYRGQIQYMPNGSDIAFTEGEDLSEIRRQGQSFLNVSPNKPVLLYVGQLRWIKNIKLIIDALNILSRREVPFQMRFVGDGADQDDIKNYAGKFRFGSRVGFTGPVKDRHLMKSIYAATDIFVFPSLYDNASLATREAAGLNVPTVFIEGATTAYKITDNRDGFLASNDAESFAARLIEILSNPEQIKTVGRDAKQLLYLPWEKIADMVYNKYQEIRERYKFEQLRKITTIEDVLG